MSDAEANSHLNLRGTPVTYLDQASRHIEQLSKHLLDSVAIERQHAGVSKPALGDRAIGVLSSNHAVE
jgi:hypothetical protein